MKIFLAISALITFSSLNITASAQGLKISDPDNINPERVNFWITHSSKCPWSDEMELHVGFNDPSVYRTAKDDLFYDGLDSEQDSRSDANKHVVEKFEQCTLAQKEAKSKGRKIGINIMGSLCFVSEFDAD